MSERKRVVVIGGGTGTFAVLRGLKKYRDVVDISAVVTMADSGGSTGRLRDAFGYLPVGDVRMALVALADEHLADDRVLRELFLYRFSRGGPDLEGHNFGNLLLVALTDILGSEIAAIRCAERLLHTAGSVHPVTTENVTLVATYDDGVVVRGEARIDAPSDDRRAHTITALSVMPEGWIAKEAKEALLAADLIVLGPGDLYTSILAVCVVGGVRDVLCRTHARLTHVANLMTKKGQTQGMSLEGHLAAIESTIGRTVDIVFQNTTPLPPALIEYYRHEGEYPVIASGGRPTYATDLLFTDTVTTSASDTVTRSLLRHDPDKLGAAIMKCI